MKRLFFFLLLLPTLSFGQVQIDRIAKQTLFKKHGVFIEAEISDKGDSTFFVSFRNRQYRQINDQIVLALTGQKLREFANAYLKLTDESYTDGSRAKITDDMLVEKQGRRYAIVSMKSTGYTSLTKQGPIDIKEAIDHYFKSK